MLLVEVVKGLWHAGGAIAGVFLTRSKSEEYYRYIVPALKAEVEAGATMQDENVQKAIKLLEELPAYGIQRHNFKRKYLVDCDSILRLPDDPRKIMYGYWW